MEQLMIEYAVSNGMRYDDYFILKRGVVIFRCFDKKGKEKFYEVLQWSPFKVQIYV